jgi:hypothetical protein
MTARSQGCLGARKGRSNDRLAGGHVIGTRSPWNALANALERLGHALSTGEDMEHEGSGTTCSQVPYLSRTKVPGQYHHGQYHQPPRSWQLFNGGHQRGVSKNGMNSVLPRSHPRWVSPVGAQPRANWDACAPLKMKMAACHPSWRTNRQSPRKVWSARVGRPNWCHTDRKRGRSSRSGPAGSFSIRQSVHGSSQRGRVCARSDPAGPGAGGKTMVSGR